MKRALGSTLVLAILACGSGAGAQVSRKPPTPAPPAATPPAPQRPAPRPQAPLSRKDKHCIDESADEGLTGRAREMFIARCLHR